MEEGRDEYGQEKGEEGGLQRRLAYENNSHIAFAQPWNIAIKTIGEGSLQQTCSTWGHPHRSSSLQAEAS